MRVHVWHFSVYLLAEILEVGGALLWFLGCGGQGTESGATLAA